MDVVVTVPKGAWEDWIDEGDLPGAALAADPETVEVLAAALHAAPVLYHSLDTEPGDWLSSKDVAAALLRELMGEHHE